MKKNKLLGISLLAAAVVVVATGIWFATLREQAMAMVAFIAVFAFLCGLKFYRGSVPSQFSLRSAKDRLPDYGYAFNRIKVFENEKIGWDGELGLPASPSVVAEVRKFLAVAQKQRIEVPSLAMGGDGSVAVIWTDKNFYISADFDGSAEYSFFISEGESFIASGACLTDKLDESLSQALKKYLINC
jgi:hypothetical protein